MNVPVWSACVPRLPVQLPSETTKSSPVIPADPSASPELELPGALSWFQTL